LAVAVVGNRDKLATGGVKVPERLATYLLCVAAAILAAGGPSMSPARAEAPPPPKGSVECCVHFNFDRSNIRPQDTGFLDRTAETLKAHSHVSITVNGYCDGIGSVGYNLRLSKRRADAVIKYLADRGVAESHMISHHFGKTHFVATNRTWEGRARNRRVELGPIQ
jgi:OmpA-OmpF porin, OOP family